ncbi:inositol monophosphatase family protein [Oceanicola sp. S124]|uniref:inositol monophosphatase family protein n=1 Tax=Oceanicola sp. S124 TaxID=1042378 RepID=UPI0002557E8E|nr:inositol monophosphatase [Oceanicola sp. S124]
MTDQDQAARLDCARLAIARAADLALEHFHDLGALSVETKTGPGDPVSQADRSVEDLLRHEIASAFPEDAILGEERGLEAGTSGWTWVIDPIDGTMPFLHGLPSWTVVLAVLHEGRTVAGLIAEPCRDRLYRAEAGRGAWLETADQAPQRLRASTATDLAGQVVACGPGAPVHAARIGTVVARLTSAEASFMRNGSAALSLALVAAGHYAGFHEPELSAWDCLAGRLLVTEAGGHASPFDLADPTRRQVVTCTGPALFGALGTLVEV